ncbi:Y-family DNA polymerase [Flavihumibacter solisilvae]|uniref:Nucleotidyltransferase n=1 Tax=Flavihumibacter solisilvae TaxID=1349421 RepID=A0A0C1IGT7_9BACT|nr:DNA polymerase Y family protein [Flavihumibacter solisilvae]KIC93405.1 nucleotidyltransferase [Flavihumibacter solisilvae]
MEKRFVAIWFPHLATDWVTRSRRELEIKPFVLSAASGGRMVITASNLTAESNGVFAGMVVADAKAIVPDLEVLIDKPGFTEKLLKRIAIWCIRFSPLVAVDLPGGILLDATGCPHLWNSDQGYVDAIAGRLSDFGYDVRIAMADTIGCAWAMARFGSGSRVIEKGRQLDALLPLPPEALRLPAEDTLLLQQLGLRQVSQVLGIPRASLRRRFGQLLLDRLDMALGNQEENLIPVVPAEPWQERLYSLDPISTMGGIEIALGRLLETLCEKLQQEEKGLRTARFKGFRVDGKTVQVEISTTRPSTSVSHLFKLFELKLQDFNAESGVEVFILEAPVFEDNSPVQQDLWQLGGSQAGIQLSELIDRLSGKYGSGHITRYLPDAHYWPERSIKSAGSLLEQPQVEWRTDRARPVELLPIPEKIEVTAPIPDYPPMLFRHKGKLHTIKKADGPERIEQEWWIEEGEHRDYYAVEDETGKRYWLFRSGHYTGDKSPHWFLHGFFA